MRVTARLCAYSNSATAAPLAVCRDRDDDEVLALALLAQADVVIVSGRQQTAGALASYQGIPIVTAARALQRIAAGG